MFISLCEQRNEPKKVAPNSQPSASLIADKNLTHHEIQHIPVLDFITAIIQMAVAIFVFIRWELKGLVKASMKDFCLELKRKSSFYPKD